MEIRPVHFRWHSGQAVGRDTSWAVPTPFYRGEDLQSGNWISGPAVIVRADTTILIGRTDVANVDGLGNVWITVGEEQL
jgi:N-methylhydantoinase A/oxoprolinase/acetone carboxylase beta subunit